jgi:hypothetical protein
MYLLRHLDGHGWLRWFWWVRLDSWLCGRSLGGVCSFMSWFVRGRCEFCDGLHCYRFEEFNRGLWFGKGGRSCCSDILNRRRLGRRKND